MEKLLSVEAVAATEAGAVAAARLMGRGDRDAADHAAVEAMRRAMEEAEMAGTIVIGEGSTLLRSTTAASCGAIRRVRPVCHPVISRRPRATRVMHRMRPSKPCNAWPLAAVADRPRWCPRPWARTCCATTAAVAWWHA